MTRRVANRRAWPAGQPTRAAGRRGGEAAERGGAGLAGAGREAGGRPESGASRVAGPAPSLPPSRRPRPPQTSAPHARIVVRAAPVLAPGHGQVTLRSKHKGTLGPGPGENGT